jgi:DNA-binding IclR family transcriptional regulator
MTSQGARYQAPAAACAAQVLHKLIRSPEPLTLAQLSHALPQTKSLIYRVLNELEAESFITKDSTGRYRLGVSAFEAGPAYLAHHHIDQVVRESLQWLSREGNVTVNLGVLQGTEILYLHKQVSPDAYVSISRVGGRVPANCVAIGKVLLAELSDDQVLERYGHVTRLPAMTPRSIPDTSRLLQELRLIRNQGYASDRGEAAVGRCGLAVSVVSGIAGDEPTAISLSADESDFDSRHSELLELLRSVKQAIQRDALARQVMRATGAFE